MSDLPISTSGGVTMTSREIAELTGKRHDHVMRDIESMLVDLGATSPQIWGDLPDSYGRPQRVVFLPKRETLILVSGYSVAMRAKIIDRWQELEAGLVPQVPQTMAQALRLAAEQAELLESAQLQIAEAAPKVEFHDRYAASTGNKGFREVCKLLHANEREFREFLISARIMYRLAGELTPMAPHIDAGRFVVKAGTSLDTGHAFNQPKFTPKGVTWVAGEWAKHCLHSPEHA
ncbi:phage antirepressor YoqD-like protein [Variovorax boronicumulans]|uniref:phage antirepressor KilAC domain-containing protein n=1 Tax=Variovorax boronicumulans TaxID=436515 RepID=UPI002780B4FC|nr:phage antirepressor KilAC domain-containing protein [Variovorax boronicumulans]MDQ0035906.1 phage antirepressor YoqD-like protein [Variovorax boronicumulans]